MSKKNCASPKKFLQAQKINSVSLKKSCASPNKNFANPKKKLHVQKKFACLKTVSLKINIICT
jgi:hypothetical protein